MWASVSPLVWSPRIGLLSVVRPLASPWNMHAPSLGRSCLVNPSGICRCSTHCRFLAWSLAFSPSAGAASLVTGAVSCCCAVCAVCAVMVGHLPLRGAGVVDVAAACVCVSAAGCSQECPEFVCLLI